MICWGCERIIICGTCQKQLCYIKNGKCYFQPYFEPFEGRPLECMNCGAGQFPNEKRWITSKG